MPQNYCPECGGNMLYDAPLRRYLCRSCGLYLTKEQIMDMKDKVRDEEERERKKRRERDEYLEWWLSKK